MLALVALAFNGCATAPIEPPKDVGAVSGEVLHDPAQPIATPSVDEVHEPPRQMAGNAMPSYPPALVSKRLPPVSVSVRIVVGSDGQVASVEPLTPDQDEQFLAAVRASVLTWRYEPFVVIEWADSPDANGDGEPDGQHVAAERAKPFRFDMRFTFEVVNGKPKVSG